MDRATEIAHRVMPSTGSEWPLSAHGRAVAVGHAASIIQAEMSDLHSRIEELETRIVGLEAMLCDAQEEVGGLKAALREIAEWSSGDLSTLGAIKLVAMWQELAHDALQKPDRG